MRAPHSSTPAALQSESPHQECAGHGKASQSKPRNWKNRLLLQPPELGDDSDLSSSSGSIVPYVHPTEGKTHLSIKDTEDYLTVQNPNPHTGRMSPAFSSVVTELRLLMRTRTGLINILDMAIERRFLPSTTFTYGWPIGRRAQGANPSNDMCLPVIRLNRNDRSTRTTRARS